jgi:hypothetical protein
MAAEERVNVCCGRKAATGGGATEERANACGCGGGGGGTENPGEGVTDGVGKEVDGPTLCTKEERGKEAGETTVESTGAGAEAKMVLGTVFPNAEAGVAYGPGVSRKGGGI